jgi:phosphoribosylglycinamide formyltransferase-1
MKWKWAVLVGGRGSNLAALLRAGTDVRLVVSHRAGVGALDVARSAAVPATVLEPGAFCDRAAYDQALLDVLVAAGVDGVVLAGFLRLLGPVVVDAFAGRLLNVHPSLLPAFPGLHAPRQALAAGVRVTGTTVHFVDRGMDTGPIIAQVPVPVWPDDTEATLTARIQAVEHRLLPRVVQLVEAGEVAWIDGRVRLAPRAARELSRWYGKNEED